MPDLHAALDAIGQLPDAEIDLADAALQLARIDTPDADWLATQAQLSRLARAAAAMATDVADHHLPAQAAALTRLVCLEHRYHGSAEGYDKPERANLIRVVEQRCGLPVALGVIWLHTARAAGWQAHGVDFPGHFLIALAARGEQLVLDVFAGGTVLAARDLRALLKRVEGPKAELRPGLLQPMENRAVLLRLQQNIKLRRLHVGDIAGALACTADMLRFAPEEFSQWREAAVMHQRLDQVSAALRCYTRFLQLAPKGPATDRVQAAMDKLRSRLN